MSSLGSINNTVTNSPLKPNDVTEALYVSGMTIDIATFIFGSILMIGMFLIIILFVFGRPIMDAKNATNGLALIQHTDTPRSANFKLSTITGEGFRYKQVRDGTVAASPKAVYSVNGKNIVLTYAQLGVTIPVNILSGISTIVSKGINNIAELNKKYTENGILKNDTIVSGYDFKNFKVLKEQTKKENLVTLIIEAFPDFITKNINADLTEKSIIITEELNKIQERETGLIDIMKWVIAFLAVIIIGFLVVK